MSGTKSPIVIKKYANRRLYNTGSSSYVTLEFLSKLVRDDVEFVVIDAKSGDDITRQVLTQIIFEEENGDSNLLSVNFLRDLISYYGKSVQSFFPAYLEMSIKNFAQYQDQWRKAFSMDNSPHFDMFSNTIKANMEMFSKAAQAMTGFPNPYAPKTNDVSQKPKATETEQTETAPKDDVAALQLQAMQEQLKAMQIQIDKIAKGK